jgi:hypothetical protein
MDLSTVKPSFHVPWHLNTKLRRNLYSGNLTVRLSIFNIKQRKTLTRSTLNESPTAIKPNFVY